MNPKLKRLHKARADLSCLERSFHLNLFVGALSANVPDSAWNNAMKIAMKVVLEDRAKKEEKNDRRD